MATAHTSTSFAFLAAHHALLDHLAVSAERYLVDDPATCFLKLRHFGEVLAQRTAANAGLDVSIDEKQVDLLGLRDAGMLPREVAALFHGLRKAGHVAAHDIRYDHREALYQLRGTQPCSHAACVATRKHKNYCSGGCR